LIDEWHSSWKPTREKAISGGESDEEIGLKEFSVVVPYHAIISHHQQEATNQQYPAQHQAKAKTKEPNSPCHLHHFGVLRPVAGLILSAATRGFA
jgi:hypothetical protein